MEEVKVKPVPVSAAANSSAQYWQEQDKQFKARQLQRESEVRRQTTAVRSSRSLSGGRLDGSDTSNCNYAKDILSGALVRKDGRPTSDADKDNASKNVSATCH